VILTVILLLFARPDEIPGVDRYCENAEQIALLRAQTDAEAAQHKPPSDQQYLVVEDVLKGILFERRIAVPAGTLQSGQQAILLKQYEHPSSTLPYLQTDHAPGRGGTVIWPIDKAGVVDTGRVPLKSRSYPGAGEAVRVSDIRRYVSLSSPEEVDLSRHVVMACVRPELFADLAKKNPDRATFVRFTTVIRDLDRDVATLALLLESPDKATADGAAQRLRDLTGLEASRRAWPPVPKDLQMPVDKPPAELVNAVRNRDGTAFTVHFRAWLDSGVMRERAIAATVSLPRGLRDGSNLPGWGGGSGPQLPPAPRLLTETVLRDEIAADVRLNLMFLAAAYWNYERFRAERLEARERVLKSDPDSELVRRAAFWELRESNISTVGAAAVAQLARSENPESQRLLQQQFLARVDSPLFGAAQVALQHGRKTFADAMFDHVVNHDDEIAHWCVRLLVYYWPDPLMVHKLIEWHASSDPALKARAAAHLKWLDWVYVPQDAQELFQRVGIRTSR
jgi:hypothetical protein